MKRLLILAVLLAAAALSGGVGRSQATFVTTSDLASQTFGASTAFNGVAVALTDPGTPLRSTVGLSATASSDRALSSVTFQRSPAGAGTWTTICAPAAAPYTCSWNTGAVSDGLYDLRAVALDASGYSRTDTVSSRRVDNTAPATGVTVATPVTGSPTVSATATDTGGSGVISVAFEYRPSSGGIWSSACTTGTNPYSCAWNTTALADGAYDVRATATDAAGNTSSATTTNRIVDNTAPTITLTNPGSPIGGAVTLGSTTGDGAGSGVASVAYQYRTNPSGAWTAACSSSTAPFSCTWTTPATGVYDLRAIATDGVAKATTSAVVASRQVDNTPPSSATLNAVASPLRGSVTLSGSGTDAIGLASMRFEYKPSSGSTWSTACSSPAPAPFSCSWDTTAIADGSYDVRAVAVDRAGNSTSSTTSANRVVDNTGPAVTVNSPGMFRTSTTVTATASDPNTVASVLLEYSVAGANSWSTICTRNAAPYSCTWTPGSIADGTYDVRATATDSLGNQSTAVGSAYVNNTGPTGSDVQGTNGGVNDKLDSGDTVIFTYSAPITPSSILAGWSGASPAAIRVRVNNNGTSDSMAFYDAANTTPLGLLASGTVLNIYLDFVTGPTVFNATIARSGSTFTVTIGSLVSGAATATAKGKNTMVWQPSSQATNLTTGIAVWPTTVNESGGNDNDF